jgi:hypothetical protein
MVCLLFFLISYVIADQVFDLSGSTCHEFTSQHDSAFGHEAAEQALFRMTNPTIDGVFFDPDTELDFGD